MTSEVKALIKKEFNIIYSGRLCCTNTEKF